MRRIALAAAVTALLPLLALAARAEESAPGYAGVDLFDLPALAAAEMLVVNMDARGRPDAAAAMLDGLIARYPEASQLQALRAALALVRGGEATADAAVPDSDAAGASGSSGQDQEADLPEPAPGADDPEPEAPAPKTPALVQNGEAPVLPENTAWDFGTARLVARFRFPPVLRTHAFTLNPPADGPLAELQDLVARGLAAGNAGDLYDNRDRGHSRLPAHGRTQLSHVVYGPEARAAGIDYGLNTQILFDAPTFGNSSTAFTGGFWRSQPRVAMTTPDGALRLWQLYANNHVYVFPEHQDHDPRAEGGHGDLLPANTPYMLISQGSSGSDQPFLRAVQAILAAFRPEVKARLVEEKLIAPTVQQIFRRNLSGVGHDGYLGPSAHPSVFRAEDIDLAAMIRSAQALAADEIPPMVALEMAGETPPHPSIFADGLDEVLFNTPSAIARVWRGAQYERQFEIAAKARDPNDRPLIFHWRVLRGDADRIVMEPMDDTGARMRITLPWHEPSPVAGRPEITSARVDIAVFADNGAQLSAPAFLSMLYPEHQAREYTPDGRPLRIAYADRHSYADPLTWPERNWTDAFDYDAEGRLLGWTRKTRDGESRFTPHGLEVLETDADGRALLARSVEYPVIRGEEGVLRVTPSPGEQHFRYVYAEEADRIGWPEPLRPQD